MQIPVYLPTAVIPLKRVTKIVAQVPEIARENGWRRV